MYKQKFLKISDGMEIAISRWYPDEKVGENGEKIDNVKGVVQLHHGLAEHSLRYDRLGSILAENGWVLNAYDMRGHGRTAENAEKNKTGLFGKLSDKNGFDRVVDDLEEVIADVKKEYSGKKIILLGHSFGSFVSQGFIERYGREIDGCILSGTAGPRRALVAAGLFVAKLITFFNGKNTVSPILDKIAFGNYNARIENPRTKYDWLSKDETNVSMYMMDKWCGIDLKNSFYCDMLSGLKQIHKISNIKKIPVELPLLFFYGSDDPVGDYGKTVKALYNIYKANGIKKVDIIEYQGNRHESLNEKNKEIVEKDIISWISKI